MLNKRNSEITINLKEVPQEGESFRFNRKTGELNRALNDILGNNDYEIEFTITPLGEAYELKGKFKAQMDLICSRCAFEFDRWISENFHELLVVSKELPRTGHLGKTNHSTEGLQEGPFFNELRSSTFSISKFVHEIIALAEPIQPLGKESCDDSCENFIKAQKEGWLKAEGLEERAEGPFSVLQQLKH